MDKISYYARKGSKMHPQAKKEFVVVDGGGITTCFWGAVYEGLMGYPSNEAHKVYDTFYKKFGYETMTKVLEAQEELPSEKRDWLGLGYSIKNVWAWGIVLNDDFNWTREAIADYFEKNGL